MNHHNKNNDLGISRLAIHEAGHVAVALYFGCVVSDVSIIPGDISNGCVNTPDIDSWSLKQAALFKIAGVVAEQIIFGEADEYHHYRSDRRDLETIHRLERKKEDTLHRNVSRMVRQKTTKK
jgi:hypothetical protein